MDRYVQVTTTTGSREDAEQIGRNLVEGGLAACVQMVGPIRSTYRWQGEIETADEWLLLAKTTDARYPELEAAILRNHPYEVPEILALPVAAGSAAYLTWLNEAVTART